MNKLRVALLALVGAACAAMFGFGFGPGLLRDAPLIVAERISPHGNADVDCDVYGGIFQSCSLALRLRGEAGNDTELRDHAFFFGFGSPGYREGVVVLADARNTTRLTTSFSLNNYPSRLLTFLAFESVFLGMVLLGLMQVFARRGSAWYPD